LAHGRREVDDFTAQVREPWLVLEMLREKRMKRMAFVALVLLGGGCELQERLDAPDVAIPPDCPGGPQAYEVAGTVVDFVTGEPVAGARVDISEAWAGAREFPTNGCRLGGATTDENGRFGPLTVSAATSEATIVMLVTGAGRTPTIADRNVGCFIGCSSVDEVITSPAADLAQAWRRNLYDGGMEFALNRGLVLYRFDEETAFPAAGVRPARSDDSLGDDDGRLLEPGEEVRFVEPDLATLAPADSIRTTESGWSLIGSHTNDRGYFRVEGNRSQTSHWNDVGVMVATGWIYTETAKP
jgi:hypothetical protein